METNTQAKASYDARDILDGQLRESFGRVVYSHKVHEKEADILLVKLSRIKLGQILLPALSTGGFVTMLLGTGWWGSLAGAMFSATLLALNLYTRNYDLGRLARQHRDVAARLWLIREQYLSLITDLAMKDGSLADIQGKRDGLIADLNCIYTESPRTTEAAYKRAHKALNLQEEMTFSVAEIDAFLPRTLRKSQ